MMSFKLQTQHEQKEKLKEFTYFTPFFCVLLSLLIGFTIQMKQWTIERVKQTERLLYCMYVAIVEVSFDNLIIY